MCDLVSPRARQNTHAIECVQIPTHTPTSFSSEYLHNRRNGAHARTWKGYFRYVDGALLLDLRLCTPTTRISQRADSALPYKRTPASWVKYNSQYVEDNGEIPLFVFFSYRD